MNIKIMKTIIYLFTALSLLSFGLIGGKSPTKKAKTDQGGLDISLINSNISPKEDFYGFVNGKWMEQAEIPADRGSWGTLDQIHKNTSENTLFALKKAIESDTYEESSDQYKAMVFFDLAMDEKHANSLGYAPIGDLLKKIHSISDEKSLHDYLVTIMPMGIRGFFDFEVFPDFQNSRVNALFLFTGKLGIPDKNFYLSEDERALEVRSSYKKMVQGLFLEVGYDEQTARTKAQNIITMESLLAQSMMDEAEKRNPVLLYNVKSIDELTQLTPSINWTQYLEDLNMGNTKTIVVTEPKYLDQLQNVISNTGWESIQDYLEMHLINHAGSYLGNNLALLKHEFYGKTLWGANEMRPRWEFALEQSNNCLSHAVGKVYVDEFFSEESKTNVLEMVDNIQWALKERLSNIEWMSESTKQEAMLKLEHLTTKIGYPDKWLDYKELDIKTKDQGGSFYSNVISANAWNFELKLSKVGEAVDHTEWEMPPQTVNAYYHPLKNQITFTAAFLQAPFYSENAAPAINYGAIGAVIGHEISHGFDDVGSRFDAEGNMRNWWADEDRLAYEERTRRLVNQFNSYEVLQGLNVNGELTLGENISDLLGISLAYDALQKHLEEKDKNSVIHGFSPEQQFYISYATIWRTVSTDEALENQVKTDAHSPGKFRALGPIENIDSFFEAFDISEGNAMYKKQEDRIKIW